MKQIFISLLTAALFFAGCAAHSGELKKSPCAEECSYKVKYLVKDE